MEKELQKIIAFKTIGCRLNQFETDSLLTQFNNAGYKIAGNGDIADIVVINTCTVTHQSDKKSKYAINKAAADNPNAIIIAAGCLVNNQKKLLEKKKNITFTVDNERKSSIFSLVEAYSNGEIINPDLLPANVFGYETAVKGKHTRSFIKIQDGCNNFCSFCIVPMVRGRAVSRKPFDIIENVKKIINAGYREIVLTGVNIGRYNFESVNLEKLLEMILNVQGDFRVRISSVEPYGLTRNFHELFFHPKLTPHLHLCLQSGSDAILKRMGRRYSAKSFMSLMESFKINFPSFNFTTDIMVGFPGESDTDFESTCKIAKEAAFSHIHTFRFSRRSGTKADKMEDQISEKIKEERSKIILEISEKNRIKYFNSMLGKTQKVLVEKIDQNGIASGYGEHYIPIEFKYDEAKTNNFYSVRTDNLSKNKFVRGSIIIQ